MATPTLVQCVTSGYIVLSDTGATVTMFLPQATLSGNLLAVTVVAASGETITVADSAGNTYLSFTAQTDSSESTMAQIWYHPDTSAGVTWVSAKGSSAGNNVLGIVFVEYYNIATTTPADGSSGNHGTSATWTSGSLTPTANGDLILSFHWNDQTIPADTTSAINPGSGFGLLYADRVCQCAAQYQVQATAAAINPTITVTGSTGFISVACAFKSASAGTAPTANYQIRRRLTTFIDSSSGGWNSKTITLQFPCSGNMLAAAWDGALPTTSLSMTDSNSNTWTLRNNKSASGYVSVLDTGAAATTSNAMTVTLVLADNTTSNMICLLDIVTANGVPTSNYDSAGSGSNSGTTGNFSAVNVLTITPSTSGGLVILSAQTAFGSFTATTSPTNTNLLISTYPTEAVPNFLDENNLRAVTFPPSTSSLTYTITGQSQGGQTGWGNWSAAAASYSGPVTQDPAGVASGCGTLFMGMP